VHLVREDVRNGEDAAVLLAMEDIAEARLVLTDELIAESMRRGKQANASSSRKSRARTVTSAARQKERSDQGATRRNETENSPQAHKSAPKNTKEHRLAADRLRRGQIDHIEGD